MEFHNASNPWNCKCKGCVLRRKLFPTGVPKPTDVWGNNFAREDAKIGDTWKKQGVK